MSISQRYMTKSTETFSLHTLKITFQALNQMNISTSSKNCIGPHDCTCLVKTLISKDFKPYQVYNKEEMRAPNLFTLFLYKKRCEEMDTEHLSIQYCIPISSHKANLQREIIMMIYAFIDGRRMI